MSAELHTLGALPLLDAALETLCRAGARLAEPGEFTLRAFLAGRIDLTQAEAVLGVIDADDAATLQTALGQLAGGLAQPLQSLRSDLLDLLADLEAGLDFADEDIQLISDQQAEERLARAHQSLTDVLGQIDTRGTADYLVRVVIRGLPNVGKSSLLNALCDDQVALASRQAGTTRDYVSRVFRWHDQEGLLVDTAGVENRRAGSLRGEAQVLAEQQLAQADLELLCLDASRQLAPRERDWLSAPQEHRIVVWTKIDLAARPCPTLPHCEQSHQHFTSSRTGAGIAALRSGIAHQLATSNTRQGFVVTSTASRCRTNLESAAQHLQRARQTLLDHQGQELVAWELRDALDQIGQVVGAVYTDDILDRVFQRFCIGK